MYGSWSTIRRFIVSSGSGAEETKGEENGGCKNENTDILDRRQQNEKQQVGTQKAYQME